VAQRRPAARRAAALGPERQGHVAAPLLNAGPLRRRPVGLHVRQLRERAVELRVERRHGQLHLGDPLLELRHVLPRPGRLVLQPPDGGHHHKVGFVLALLLLEIVVASDGDDAKNGGEEGARYIGGSSGTDLVTCAGNRCGAGLLLLPSCLTL
jgi:hypothetical protein